ncbi:MAG: hypothetical protein KC434_08750 [Anaerolineales bacterium]|nr:hypothetical protein [Anaerolineales bacterium]
MKRVWTLLLLLVGTAVFLTACRSNQAPESVAPTMQPTVAATAVPNELATSAPAGNDLSLIGQTGRPQFLNAYASW